MSLVLNDAVAPLSRQILKIHGETAKRSELWADLEKCAKIPEEFSQASADFYWRTSVKSILSNKFALNLPYQLSVGGGYFEEFHKEDTIYPKHSKQNYAGWVSSDSVYTLALGVDQQKLHAIVYVGSECGSLCGNAQYYFLRRLNGVWRLAPEVHSCEMVS